MSDTPVRVYLDTNVFISAFEGGADVERARDLLKRIESATCTGVTSEITLAELLVMPLREGDDELADIYRAMIAPAGAFRVRAISRDVLEQAGRLRAHHHSLKLPDAIHLATALLETCTHFVSDDRSIPGVGPMRPSALGDPGLASLLERR